jgi:hypothetical protein
MQKTQRVAARDIVPKESDEQQSLFRYCAVELSRRPELEMLVHTPNEGKRTAATGGRLKKEGLRKGYPDITLYVPRCGYCGLMIELKRVKNYHISPEQKGWIKNLNKYGYAAVFCYGWEHAWDVIRDYLDGKIADVNAAVVASMEKAGAYK